MVATSNNNSMNEIRNMETLIKEFNDNATKDVDRFLSAFTNLLTMASSSEDNLEVIAAGVKIDLLFNALSEAKIGSRLTQPQNKSVLSDLCKFLRLVLTRFDPIDVFTKYGNYILESLSETTVEEYHLECMNQILRLAENGSFEMFMSNPEILVFLIKSLGKSSLTIATSSRKIILKVIEIDGSNGWMFSNEIYNEVSLLLKTKDAAVKFRVYEIFLDVLKGYPEHLQRFEEHGSFNGLFADLTDSNDVLSQLNALELITNLALTGNQGLEFVERKGTIEWLQLIVSSDDPLTQFLLPGKFLSLILILLL